MSKPKIQIPEYFALNGEKADFNNEKIENGYDRLTPDVLPGDCLNKFIDDTYKGLNGVLELYQGAVTYDEEEIYNNKSIIFNIDENNEIKIYRSLVNNNQGNPLENDSYWQEVKLGGGGGLEVCDIGTALYVDETKGLRRYLNGSTVAINSNTQAFLDRLKEIRTLHPEYFTDEATWQSEALLNIDGCVYKFVIDETAGTIRLPKYPEYVELNKSKATVPVRGNGMTLGFTDGNRNYFSISATGNSENVGILKKDNYGQELPSKSTTAWNTGLIGINDRVGITTDGSKSGIVANTSNVLSQTKLKLRYFIQIATGQETEVDIINEIELNNPYSFGDCKYTEIELSNLSWLRSNGQWNNKAVYVDYYNWILANANGNVDKFKKSTDTYTDYDWVVNTSNETFRLPIKTNLASGKAVVGNGSVIGLDDAEVASYPVKYKLATGTDFVEYVNFSVATGGHIGTGANKHNFGLSTDATKSGMELSDSNLYLYYYVGETVQNANLINAGRIVEKLIDKVDYANTQWAVNACIPDYANGIVHDMGTATSATFTVPADGLIWISVKANGSGAISNATINGNVVMQARGIGSGYTHTDYGSFLVSKGDIIVLTSPGAGDSDNGYRFFPLKGAN